MLILDGSMGEGGGQILRTALALSTVTGIPFRIRNVRAGRPKPGLARQHLTSLRAAARVAAAKVEGAQLHSTDVTFRPRDIRPGAYRFSTGGAGSGTLVLQTVLPSLLVASAPSEVVLEGGTHNPFAPPFDFVERALVPLLVRMGARLQLTLDRPGFYPAGGGRFRARVQPARRLRPLVLPARGAVVARRARALVSALPRHIAERELDTVGRLLRIGPGAHSVVEVRCQAVTEVFTGFGERGVPAEEVARTAAEQARQWESADVAVGPHLADQLLLPLALAGGGSFTTIDPTSHTRTNAEVIRRFLDVGVTLAPLDGGVWQVDVG
jgi:RNA 3'-terminal phosphate cyclase (ATP)